MANTVVVSTSDPNMDDEPLWMQAVGGDTAIQYSGTNDRTLIDAVFVSQGVFGSGTVFQVTQRGAGANFSVDVAAGMAVVTGDDVANQGKYLVASRGIVNVVTPSAPASGTRVHRIIIRIRDKQAVGSGTYDWTIELLEDTGTGTPNEPNSAITLALVSIASGQASVTNANISDKRPYASVVSSTLACTSSTRPSSPVLRQQIYETDTKKFWTWDGAYWRPQPGQAVLAINTAINVTNLDNGRRLVWSYSWTPPCPGTYDVRAVTPTDGVANEQAKFWLSIGGVDWDFDMQNFFQGSFVSVVRMGHGKPYNVTSTAALTIEVDSQRSSGGSFFNCRSSNRYIEIVYLGPEGLIATG